MAKKKNNKERSHESIIDSGGGFNGDYKKIIIVSAIVVIIFATFYFLTVFITNKNSEKDNTTEDTTSSSYSEVMVGRTFALPEEEYLVLYYDYSDETLKESFKDFSVDYHPGVGPYAFYVADMSDAINKSYVSETSNTAPTKASELSISGPTLIHFRDGAVIEYIEGEENILNYLQ